jgi:predicted glutamine amidotransferase
MDSADAPRRIDQISSHGTRVHCEPGRDRPFVVVASERMDDDPAWREVLSGELLHVGHSLKLETELVADRPSPHL